jgi:hypothetical protein
LGLHAAKRSRIEMSPIFPFPGIRPLRSV